MFHRQLIEVLWRQQRGLADFPECLKYVGGSEPDPAGISGISPAPRLLIGNLAVFLVKVQLGELDPLEYSLARGGRKIDPGKSAPHRRAEEEEKQLFCLH